MGADINSSVYGKSPQPRIWKEVDDSTKGTFVESQTSTWHYAMSWKETVCTQDEHNGVFEGIAMTFGIAIFFTNLIVVLAIKRGGRKLHKATFYCICNLAVADMLAGLLLLWVFGLQRVMLPFRSAMSELVQKSIWTLTVWASLLSQVVIAVDRYSHVTRSSKGDAAFPRGSDKWGNKQRKRRIIIGIILTWLIPTLTYVLPVMTTWNCAGNCSCYFRNNNTDVIYMTCLPLEQCSQINPPFRKSNMLFMSLILLLLPFVPVVLYLKIFIFVRNSSKNLCPPEKNGNGHNAVSAGSYTENGWNARKGAEDSHAHYSKDESSGSRTEALITQDDDNVFHAEHDKDGKTVVDGNPKKSWLRYARSTTKSQSKTHINKSSTKEVYEPNTDKEPTKSKHSPSGKSNNALRKRSQRRDMRLLRTLVMILGLFVISTVPLGILFLMSVWETDKQYVEPAKYLLTLSLLNSLVNPWVYFWRFREMRAAIRRLFCSPCCSRNQSHRRRGEKPCGCCHLPAPRKVSFFTSSHSTKKGTSSSSSSAF